MTDDAEQRANGFKQHQANMNTIDWFIRTNGIAKASNSLDDRMAAVFTFLRLECPAYQTSMIRERRLKLIFLVARIQAGHPSIPWTVPAPEPGPKAQIVKPKVTSAAPKPHKPIHPARGKTAAVSIEEGLAFYKTADWKRARLDALIRLGRRCGCCGASPETGAVLNVDHIRPLRFNWGLRLDPNNLQILCSDCNHGKGNRIEADFRSKPAHDEPADLDHPMFQTRDEIERSNVVEFVSGIRRSRGL